MSQTTDYRYGFQWPIVFGITVQFAILWILAQLTLNGLINKGWRMNLNLFILGVFGIVIVNIILYFVIKSIVVLAIHPELSLYSHLAIGLTTLEGFLKGILVMSMLFSLRFFKQWEFEAEENRELKKNEVELQNRALKSQLNPHFLFNNLNTLSGLIQKDQGIANEFLKEMSDMYRYILKTTDKEVVPLNDEIQFAENYCYLMQKRFGKNFNYSILVNDLNYMLPPISLNLLLENMIKHNRIDSEHTMKISIIQNEGFLFVENTIHMKDKVDSTKKGLHILKQQYKFLTDQEITISQKNSIFLVKLPLLKFKG
jgi:sensor histidine kinase YesM